MQSYSKRARGVASSSPASTTVKTHSLICNNLENASSAECLGVCLAFNLQNIEREEDDLSDSNQTKSKSASALRSTASPTNAYLPAVACIIAFPVPLPKALSNWFPWCWAR